MSTDKIRKIFRYPGALIPGSIFALLVLCCSFCQRFIPGAVYRAIPAHATFTCRADSLTELKESPVYGLLDRALGAGNSMDALLNNNRWVRLAAPAEIAVATIPPDYPGRSKTWAAVSWVGWRSPWLRWKLEHTRIEGFRYTGKHAVWPIWQYETPGVTRGASLTFALTDTLFIACLSDNPADICLLLDTYDKRVPSCRTLN